MNKIKRPIVIIFIGYLLGIIWGLYINISIVPFCIFGISILIKNKICGKNCTKIRKSKKLNLYAVQRYMGYIKIYTTKATLFTLMIFSLVGSLYTNYLNYTYNNLYEEGVIEIEGYIVSNIEEKTYSNMYTLEVASPDKYKNTKVNITTSKENQELIYGDYISIIGEYSKPDGRRNYMGFDYESYLKTKKIFGTIKVSEFEKIENKNLYQNYIEISKYFNSLNQNIRKSLNNILDEKTRSIVIGLVLGDSGEIEEEIMSDFRIANISHILAISGLHISYIILFVTKVAKKPVGRNLANYIVIIFLIIYIMIAKTSPSIIRASVMGIILIVSKILHEKNDFWVALSFSGLLILIYNPFLINHLGFQLSYLGTIGIVLMQKNVIRIINKLIKKIPKLKSGLTFVDENQLIIKNKAKKKIIKIKKALIEISAVTISAQLAIFPILIFNTNIYSTYFLITNILISYLIPIILILSFLVCIVASPSPIISSYMAIPLKFLIGILIKISGISNLPYSSIYTPTPNIYQVILMYLLLIICNLIYTLYFYSNLTKTKRRIRQIIAMYKYKYVVLALEKVKYSIRVKIFKVIKLLIIVLIILNILLNNNVSIFNWNLKTYFTDEIHIRMIDVGQGDSSFITTSKNQTILIDGGGSINYDVGKNTVLPYILDRGYTKINYIIVTHFDTDHVGGIISVIKELPVDNIIISKQIEETEHYTELKEICSKNNINLIYTKQGDIFKIEKNLEIEILWPQETQLRENILNNNSIVFKLNYYDFSMLYTGDIEEEAEREISRIFKEQLNSDILKVAHHGSKTSSIKEFIKYVEPIASVICVGKGNNFNHPNIDVIERLEEYSQKIYRTDVHGEIEICVNKNGGIKMNTFL